MVRENLRAICVWQYASAPGRNISLWWDYALAWDKRCSSSADTWTEACSYNQMGAVDTSGQLSSAVEKCVIDSGGADDEGGVNDLLQREAQLYSSSWDLFMTPTVFVQSEVVADENGLPAIIDCNDTSSASSCPVLAYICSDIREEERPEMCYRLHSAAPTPAPFEVLTIYLFFAKPRERENNNTLVPDRL